MARGSQPATPYVRRVRHACGIVFTGLSLSAAQGITAQDTDLTFSSVTAGGIHTCGLTDTGAPYCWGGAFGITPAPAPGALVYSSLSAGLEHTCGVTEDGVAYCWGGNSRGKLGDGSTVDRITPARVSGELRFGSVIAAAGHSCGITVEGDTYCWGDNTSGQLGDGAPVEEREPTPLRILFDRHAFDQFDPRFQTTPQLVTGGNTFVSLSAPFFACLDWGGEVAHLCGPHTYGITSDGAVFGWGTGFNERQLIATTPQLVEGTGPSGLALASLTAERQTCGLTVGGAAYCWNNRGLSLAPPTEPVPVSDELTFTSLDVGAGHTCGVVENGTAYCWGGPDGLGNGATEPMPVETPTRVGGDLTFTSVSTGYGHTCAVATDGTIYCWGRNDHGQLGNDSVPRRFASRSAVPVRMVVQR